MKIKKEIVIKILNTQNLDRAQEKKIKFIMNILNSSKVNQEQKQVN